MSIECNRHGCKFHCTQHGEEGPFCGVDNCLQVLPGVFQEDIDASVDRNIEALRLVLDKMLPVVAVRLKELGRIHGSPTRRIKALYEQADKVGDIINHRTPCKQGCHHCCHMGVLVGPVEVALIAAHTGIPVVALSPEDDLARVALSPQHDGSKWERRFLGVDCPFLVDGSCSIYQVRPINCRCYSNISDYPELCDLSLGTSSVPAVNLSAFVFTALEIQGTSGVADIRSYFPNVKNGKLVDEGVR